MTKERFTLGSISRCPNHVIMDKGKELSNYEAAQLLNQMSGDEIINDCENCLHFNELIHWDEGLFQQCMMGNKMWEKCTDFEHYKSDKPVKEEIDKEIEQKEDDRRMPSWVRSGRFA